MGRSDKQPAFPLLDTYDLAGDKSVARAPTLWECNWLQVKENSMDPAHLAFLHTLRGSEGFTEDFKEPGVCKGARPSHRQKARTGRSRKA